MSRIKKTAEREENEKGTEGKRGKIKKRRGNVAVNRDIEKIENDSFARATWNARSIRTAGDGQEGAADIKTSIQILRLMKKIS